LPDAHRRHLPDGKVSSEAQVQSALLARARQDAQTRVVIKGDERIEYARVVRVMDLARQAVCRALRWELARSKLPDIFGTASLFT
jgi:biopolymer transport protein ExbD